LSGGSHSSALDQWLTRFLARRGAGIRLGLERVFEVASRLGFSKGPDGIGLDCTVIVVGGTNGKGSTCAFLESILMQSGYRVACYTSPHLLSFEERLRFDGVPCPADAWLAALQQVDSAASQTPEQSLTYFELTTLAAIVQVAQSSCDVAVFEVGLGGRLDAVNVLASNAAVLTSIDLDHQDFLGDTREKIGWEKAHIARSGRPLVVGDPLPPASVAQVATTVGADLWQLGRDFNYQGDRQQWGWSGRGTRRNAMAYPALRGANQLLNASAALAVLAALQDRIPVSQGGVRQGLAMVSLPGRFQVLPGQPSVVLDVAHNPHAAGVLATNLDQMGFFPRTFAVVGILSDKDAAGMVRRLASRIDVWCLAGIEAPGVVTRSRSAESLRAIVQGVLSGLPPSERPIEPPEIRAFPDPDQALAHARAQAQPSDRIVVFGSFMTIAAVWPQAQSVGQAPHSPYAH
jgi:dihydrofolate synthase / folylpolyglutamate synthase